MIQRKRIGLVLMLMSALAPAGRAEQVGERPQTSMSLQQCLSTALANNLDLVVARKDPQIAEQNVEVERGRFDPVASVGVTNFKSVTEVFNPSDLNENESTSASGTVSQLLPFGADYTVQLSNSNFNASGPLFSIDSAYQSSLDMTFTIPLLRNFGRESTQEQLVVARRGLEISREDLRTQAQTTLETVEAAYWDLVASREALRVARASLKLARDLLDLNRKKVEVGTLAPIEITQAEAGVASREEGVIIAELALDNAEDELRRLLAIPQNDPLWMKTIIPEDEPSLQRRSVDLQQAIEAAMESRPELISARNDLINKELSERVAKTGLRPQLDLVANVNPSGNNFQQDPGLDGILNTLDDRSVVEGRLTTALKEIKDFNNYDYRVSLQYSIPVGNRAAKAQYRIATLTREKSEVRVRSLEQDISVEVRIAVRAVESGLKRVDAAHSNVVLQRKKLEAEHKKFDNGMSTSFEVLTFQTDLADAELAEIRAIVDYLKALAGVERAKGTLLEARGMRLETGD